MALDLFANGLCTTSKHFSNDERSPDYDKFCKLEIEAKEKKKKEFFGGKISAIEFTVNDLTNAKENQDDNQKMFGLIKERKTIGYVDKVLSGSRFRLNLPKHNCVLILSLSGISTSVGGNNKDKKMERPFLEESLLFSLSKIGQKEVNIIIDRIDKSANFVGQVFVGDTNYSEVILREGLAFITHNIANRFKNYNELVSAQLVAKNAKKKIFSSDNEKIYGSDLKSMKTEKQVFSRDVEPSKSSDTFSIRVTEYVDFNHFFLQTPESSIELEKIDEILSKLDLDKQNPFTPKIGELCLSKFTQDNNWYRGKCVFIDREKNNYLIVYIDFGNKELVKPDNIRKIEGIIVILSLKVKSFLFY